MRYLIAFHNWYSFFGPTFDSVFDHTTTLKDTQTENGTWMIWMKTPLIELQLNAWHILNSLLYFISLDVDVVLLGGLCKKNISLRNRYHIVRKCVMRNVTSCFYILYIWHYLKNLALAFYKYMYKSLKRSFVLEWLVLIVSRSMIVSSAND